jgi:hypothetical protein
VALVQRLFLELLPCLVLGMALGRIQPQLSARLAGPLIRWGVPISLVGLLLRSGMRSDLVVTALIALLGPSLGLLLIALVPWLARRLDSGPMRLGAVVGNTAYWGVPVALALLPAAAVAHAITFDVVATLFTWNVGPLLMERRLAGLGPLLRRLVQNPASQGLVVALVLQQTPWSAPLGQWLWWPARLVLWLALTMVGMRLGMMLRLPLTLSWPRQDLLAAVGAKLVLAPALMLLLATLTRLPETARNAVVLQAAAPSALAVLLLAEARGDDAEPAANLVLASTALALVSVPLWWTLCGFLGS